MGVTSGVLENNRHQVLLNVQGIMLSLDNTDQIGLSPKTEKSLDMNMYHLSPSEPASLVQC